jgi:hypothetical protein
MKLSPGNYDRAAEQVVHEVETDFPAKEQDAEAFPRQAEHEDIIRAVRAEDLTDFLQIGAIGERVDPPQRPGEVATLKGAEELDHGIASPALTVVVDLDGGENDASRDSSGVDQVCER